MSEAIQNTLSFVDAALKISKVMASKDIMSDNHLQKSGLWWLGLSAIVFALDQWTKSIATQSLKLYEAVVVNDYFNWTLMHNKGMAFSLLANQSGWQRWAIGLIAIVIVCILLVWLKKNKISQKLLNLGLVMVIGGALGNIYDRMVLGYVIDFIEVHYNDYFWPSFNVADTAISLGAFFLILDLIINKDDESQSGKS
jgi:signal peptidase II